MSEKYRYELFNKFEQQKEMSEKDVPVLAEYIYHNLNCGYRVKKFYGFSNHLTKLKFVLRWKENAWFRAKISIG